MAARRDSLTTVRGRWPSWRVAGSALTLVALLGTAAFAGEPRTLADAMTALRADHAIDGLAGTGKGAASLVAANGLTIETAPPIPTLLVGVRDASGFVGHSDSADGDLSPAATAMIGSQTKTFTAAAILQLDQEGVLSIRDTLADPRWAKVLMWPNAEAITLEMVLAHTAGIPEFTATKGFQSGMSDPEWAPSPPEMLAFARDVAPTFAPGQGWHYSNTDYIILGVIIEQATGNTYEAELRSRFFEPLGLSDTGVYDGSSAGPTMPGFIPWCSADSQSAAAEHTDGPPSCPSGGSAWRPMAAPYDHVWTLIWAAGGVVSSTSDMTDWITQLVATDNVLDAEHRTLMQAVAPFSAAGMARQFPVLAPVVAGYGLGLVIFDYTIGTGYGHVGNTPGYASNSVYFPGPDNAFAMTIVAGETAADVAADGGNMIADAIRAGR